MVSRMAMRWVDILALVWPLLIVLPLAQVPPQRAPPVIYRKHDMLLLLVRLMAQHMVIVWVDTQPHMWQQRTEQHSVQVLLRHIRQPI